MVISYKDLEEKKVALEYAMNWLPFELEKAWVDVPHDREAINKRQEELDKKMFWWRIMDNPEEVAVAYSRSMRLYSDNKDKLTFEEQKRYEWYLDRFATCLPKWFQYEKKEAPELVWWEFSHNWRYVSHTIFQ